MELDYVAETLQYLHAHSRLHPRYSAPVRCGRSVGRRRPSTLGMGISIWRRLSGKVVSTTLWRRIRSELNNRSVAEADKLPNDDSLQPLADPARYLTNNRDRMDYPRYRREELPITSSPMESLIKQINQRVKGTEMFWLQPAGAKAILQIRVASLSEDGRLQDYLRYRPGHSFTRRSRLALAS